MQGRHGIFLADKDAIVASTSPGHCCYGHRLLLIKIQPRTKPWLPCLLWRLWFVDRARPRPRITPWTQILGRSTNVCNLWPNHFRFVWVKSSLGIRSPWNRHIAKVFWTSLIFSSAIIGNFAEAIPIRLKVPFLLCAWQKF